jgi:hypothetical protein
VKKSVEIPRGWLLVAADAISEVNGGFSVSRYFPCISARERQQKIYQYDSELVRCIDIKMLVQDYSVPMFVWQTTFGSMYEL